MLKLININRTDEFIEANYVPEDNGESGYVKIRLSDDEVIEQKLTSYDEVVARCFAHARDKLLDIKKRYQSWQRKTGHVVLKLNDKRCDVNR